jgi:outer membrane biosynthesis protein TonB
MASRIQLLFLLSLSLLLTSARAQTADDIFHGGAMLYLSNNIPKALEVVTNGLSRFPTDIKLKKLEELLNQKQQQNQQQQQQNQEQQQKDEKKEDKKQDQQQKEEPKQEQSGEKPEESKPDEKKGQDPKEMQAHAMTPEEAKRLLDAQKGDEQVLQFRPQEPKNRGKTLKDW